jgi:hypothetical protein
MELYRDQKTSLICIDSYDNGVPCGRIYHNGTLENRSFKSMIQLLQQIELRLEEIDYPKSYTVNRTFAPPASAPTQPGDGAGSGQIATFAVKVLFRQNASWQGSVTWLEGKREQSFRSVLELMLLLDSALAA